MDSIIYNIDIIIPIILIILFFNNSNTIVIIFINPIIPITNRNKVYDCTVWCTNLNGNPNRQLFRANGGISAKSPKEAELKFKAFLSDKFASVRIEERTITIKEMTPNKEYL